MRKTFAVGRLTPSGWVEIVLVDGGAPSPIPGPWSLRAVVRPSDDPPPARREKGTTVH